jgi:hypothetical protein
MSKANDKQVAGTHYKEMGVQPWDVVDTWPMEQRIGYYRGGALKYIMRMGRKDENIQEIKKAIHYLEKLVEVLVEREGTRQESSTPRSLNEMYGSYSAAQTQKWLDESVNRMFKPDGWGGTK